MSVPLFKFTLGQMFADIQNLGKYTSSEGAKECKTLMDRHTKGQEIQSGGVTPIVRRHGG